MKLADLTHPDLVFVDLEGFDRDRLLRFFAEQAARHADASPTPIYDGLMEREKLGSTAIGRGVAIPHTRTDQVKEALLLIGVVPGGMDYGAPDGEPVRAFFVVISSAGDPTQNLRCLSAISHWIQDGENVRRLLEMPTPPAIIELLAEVGSA